MRKETEEKPGLVQLLAEMGPSVAGAIGGAKLGAPFFPPFGAIGGAIVGGVADCNASVQSWIGHAKHGDTLGLRKKIFNQTVFIRHS